LQGKRPFLASAALLVCNGGTLGDQDSRAWSAKLPPLVWKKGVLGMEDCRAWSPRVPVFRGDMKQRSHSIWNDNPVWYGM